MESGAQRAGLDTDLVPQRHDAPLGHLAAEPAPLDQGDLVATDDHHRVPEQDDDDGQGKQIVVMVGDPTEQGYCIVHGLLLGN